MRRRPDQSPEVGLRSAGTVPWTRLLRFMTLASDLSVHCIRRQIDLTGPGDRAAINEDLLEKPHIPQRFEYTCELFSPQPHTPRQSVFESHKEAIVRLWLYFSYVPIHRTILHSG
jgi:hypothetical protein